jgi:hypothetical protein
MACVSYVMQKDVIFFVNALFVCSSAFELLEKLADG